MINPDRTAMALIDAFQEVSSVILPKAGNISSTDKTDGSPVTDLDVYVEQKIISKLQKIIPDIKIYGEESEYTWEQVKTGECWLIDPIDGTKAFINNEPTFTNMAVNLRDGQAVTSVIYNPSTKTLFTATSGNGTYKNRSRLSLNNTRITSDVVYCNNENYVGQIREILNKYGLVCMPSPSGAGHYLSQVAEGLIAGHVSIHGKGQIHDYVTGCLLIKEAGGEIISLESNTFNPRTRNFIACHPNISKTMEDISDQLRELVIR
jgi:myo-inositol-1(or 4)-monophosphatase